MPARMGNGPVVPSLSRGCPGGVSVSQWTLQETVRGSISLRRLVAAWRRAGLTRVVSYRAWAWHAPHGDSGDGDGQATTAAGIAVRDGRRFIEIGGHPFYHISIGWWQKPTSLNRSSSVANGTTDKKCSVANDGRTRKCRMRSGFRRGGEAHCQYERRSHASGPTRPSTWRICKATSSCQRKSTHPLTTARRRSSTASWKQSRT
jgi:hypothetical protein